MSRRDQIRLTPEEEREFLETSRTAILTSIGADGLPHPTAMWYATIDCLAHFATYSKSQKVVNFLRNPAAAVLVEDGDVYEELRGLLIRGRAEVIDDQDFAFRVMRGNFEKYTAGGPVDPLPQSVEEGLRYQSSKRSVIVVHPEKVTSWDHRKLGGRY